MINYTNTISVEDYLELRAVVDWAPLVKDQAQSGIDSQLKEGWRVKIEMVSAKGKEGFYEKLGFKLRPNENEGHGMNLWRQ